MVVFAKYISVELTSTGNVNVGRIVWHRGEKFSLRNEEQFELEFTS